MKLYHGTDRRNRASILEKGLCPRDTTKHNWVGVSRNEGIRAVYAVPSLEQCKQWNAYQGSGVDIWEIEADGLKMEHDPYGWTPGGYPLRNDSPLRGSMRILGRVFPRRLRLVESF